jgi:hypothetical protein
MVMGVSVMIWLFPTAEEKPLLEPDVCEIGPGIGIVSAAKLLKLKSKAAHIEKHWDKLKIFLI